MIDGVDPSAHSDGAVGIPDVNGVSLEELFGADRAALGGSVWPPRFELDLQDENYAAHNSTM